MFKSGNKKGTCGVAASDEGSIWKNPSHEMRQRLGDKRRDKLGSKKGGQMRQGNNIWVAYGPSE